MNKQIYFAILLAGLLFQPKCHAQESAALPFVAIDRNPVTAAMGGAQAVSGLYNPSAVPFTGSDLVLSYQRWAPSTFKTNNVNLLAAFKVGDKLGINLEGAFQQGNEIPQVNESGIPGSKSLRPQDLLAGLGVGFAFTENLSAGVSARFASTSIESGSSYSAVGADAFVMYHAESLSATVGVANLGTPVESKGQTYPLPASVKAGVGYRKDFDQNALRLAADADYFFVGGFGAAAGAEFGIKDRFFLRAGAHLGSGKAPLPTYVTLGAGVQFSGFHLDLCWMTANPVLGNTLHAGLGYQF